MQHDPVTQFKRKGEPFARLGRVAMRQDAGVYKAHSGGRRRSASIVRGAGQQRPPARVARFGDPFSLTKGGDGESAGRTPLKYLMLFLRAAPLVRTAWMRCFCHARFS